MLGLYMGKFKGFHCLMTCRHNFGDWNPDKPKESLKRLRENAATTELFFNWTRGEVPKDDNGVVEMRLDPDSLFGANCDSSTGQLRLDDSLDAAICAIKPVHGSAHVEPKSFSPAVRDALDEDEVLGSAGESVMSQADIQENICIQTKKLGCIKPLPYVRAGALALVQATLWSVRGIQPRRHPSHRTKRLR